MMMLLLSLVEPALLKWVGVCLGGAYSLHHCGRPGWSHPELLFIKVKEDYGLKMRMTATAWPAAKELSLILVILPQTEQ